MDSAKERISAAAVSASHAGEILRQLESCAQLLAHVSGDHLSPACAFHVPGRIEVLGKHTDYAGGRSLLTATEQGLTILARPRGDREVHVHSVASGESLRIAMAPGLQSESGWANYAVTVVRRIASNFPDARTGADIAFLGDIPIAAGMSSSSALVVAIFHAVATINGVQHDRRYAGSIATAEDLAGYISGVENGFAFGDLAGETGVGTLGGSEDHVAMLCARPAHIVRYAFAPVRFEQSIPMPAGHSFVVASSGVSAEKAGKARERYNAAAERMHAAVELWRQATGGSERTIGELLDADPLALESLLEVLRDDRHPRFTPDELLERVEQFAAESTEVIPAAAEALLREDLPEFARQVDRSQELAERLLHNQTAETIYLARTAREAGAVAASAFGAGFGGSVWAMLPEHQAQDFELRWRASYLARFPERAGDARFMHTRAAGPIARLL